MTLERLGAFLADEGPPVASQLLLILAATWLALRASHLFVRALVRLALEREAREGTARELSADEVGRRIETLSGFGMSLLRLVILVAAFLTVLAALRVDIGPAVAGLGVLGVALGFGGQAIVRDFLNGAFVLIENQYNVGDVVRIGGVSGTVEDFSLRRTTLRDADGTVHTVPNGEIGVASNLTRGRARIEVEPPGSHVEGEPPGAHDEGEPPGAHIEVEPPQGTG